MKCDLYKTTFLATCVLASSIAAPAETFNGNFGNFGDSANPVLVGSDLGAAFFRDPSAVANNVALYNLVLPAAETVDIRSSAFAAGGADSYFSLFQGSGASATFLASNYAQVFSTGGDFDSSGLLAAGQYEIALGVSVNQSFAENYGSGTLADGCIGLGDPASFGNGSYAVRVTLKSGQPVHGGTRNRSRVDVHRPDAACRQHPDLKRTPAQLLNVDLLPSAAKTCFKACGADVGRQPMFGLTALKYFQ